MKICTVCKEDKLLEEYYNSRASKDGKMWRCKPCDKLARDAYEEKHRDRKRHNQRRANRKAKYGLTDIQFQAMVTRQKNECAICNIPLVINNGVDPVDNRMAIDHDHVTLKVRGLLCQRCNRGLGHFLDDPNILRKAAEYLEFADIH